MEDWTGQTVWDRAVVSFFVPPVCGEGVGYPRQGRLDHLLVDRVIEALHGETSVKSSSDAGWGLGSDEGANAPAP